ncbi:phasin family protein [Noviherbaspirillum sp.]|uniref:phasin family protein n=1 Tax=Noviherbaspirillum sp. TaxID=1926288 RepID=UPI002B48B396|nr:phasin family protein [Noviherbaspirillum sp.]HJV79524.1 phasin family protein [Noviherbaspirillum sp.]
MPSIPEQLASATRANFEAQLGLINALTSKAFEGVEKIIELNLNATRASLEEVSEAVKQSSAAKNAQDLFSGAAAQAQPNAKKAIDYSRQLAEISANMQAEFARAAEAQVVQVAETTRTLKNLVDEASKNTPPGSESTVAMMKTAIDNANSGYEQLAKNARLAVDTLRDSMSTATSQIIQAAETIARASDPNEKH